MVANKMITDTRHRVKFETECTKIRTASRGDVRAAPFPGSGQAVWRLFLAGPYYLWFSSYRCSSLRYHLSSLSSTQVTRALSGTAALATVYKMYEKCRELSTASFASTVYQDALVSSDIDRSSRYSELFHHPLPWI